MEYTPAQYRKERALVDADWQWTKAAMAENGPRANYVSAEQSKRKPKRLQQVDNDMRGRVEQFELLRDLPDSFCAYLENGKPDGIGARLNVTCWPGNPLGVAVVHTVAKRGNMWGERQRYGRATIGGKVYRWQGRGAGIYATFRAVKSA